MNLKQIEQYAIRLHESVNHKYDGWGYSVHLSWVYEAAIKYRHLLNESEVDVALKSCWLHDTIEDCRQTYNDIKKLAGEEVADVVYAVTNEKGKTRKERANQKYYDGIKANPIAVFVKLCDRIANMRYSEKTRSRMLKMYCEEAKEFADAIYMERFAEMFQEIKSYTP